jgi:hypothetical protein
VLGYGIEQLSAHLRSFFPTGGVRSFSQVDHDRDYGTCDLGLFIAAVARQMMQETAPKPTLPSANPVAAGH